MLRVPWPDSFGPHTPRPQEILNENLLLQEHGAAPPSPGEEIFSTLDHAGPRGRDERTKRRTTLEDEESTEEDSTEEEDIGTDHWLLLHSTSVTGAGADDDTSVTGAPGAGDDWSRWAEYWGSFHVHSMGYLLFFLQDALKDRSLAGPPSEDSYEGRFSSHHEQEDLSFSVLTALRSVWKLSEETASEVQRLLGNNSAGGDLTKAHEEGAATRAAVAASPLEDVVATLNRTLTRSRVAVRRKLLSTTSIPSVSEAQTNKKHAPPLDVLTLCALSHFLTAVLHKYTRKTGPLLTMIAKNRQAASGLQTLERHDLNMGTAGAARKLLAIAWTREVWERVCRNKVKRSPWKGCLIHAGFMEREGGEGDGEMGGGGRRRGGRAVGGWRRGEVPMGGREVGVRKRTFSHESCNSRRRVSLCYTPGAIEKRRAF